MGTSQTTADAATGLVTNIAHQIIRSWTFNCGRGKAKTNPPCAQLCISASSNLHHGAPHGPQTGRVGTHAFYEVVSHNVQPLSSSCDGGGTTDRISQQKGGEASHLQAVKCQDVVQLPGSVSLLINARPRHTRCTLCGNPRHALQLRARAAARTFDTEGFRDSRAVDVVHGDVEYR